MTDMKPIPADRAGNNARRFLELQNEQLIDNNIGKIAGLLSGITPEIEARLLLQNSAFSQAEEHSRGQEMAHQFIGAFETRNSGLELVAAMELKPVSMVNLGKFFRPIDTLAAIYSATRGHSLEKHLVISSLVAIKGEDQALLLQDLLYTAMDKAATVSDTVYLTLPPVDPAHEIADELGFEPTGFRTPNRHSIPRTLFVHGLQ